VRLGASDGRLVVGRSQPGRGAWLCAASGGACLDLAVRRKALGRALRTDLAPDAVAALRRSIAERARL
jgi:predicted RNA-binding protein YlxR (DUF448 family)